MTISIWFIPCAPFLLLLLFRKDINLPHAVPFTYYPLSHSRYVIIRLLNWLRYSHFTTLSASFCDAFMVSRLTVVSKLLHVLTSVVFLNLDLCDFPYILHHLLRFSKSGGTFRFHSFS
ncbi:hypothetical protein K438DRAFT_454781 [Mycena galopus ATCC 62051]|nr:hypothetical protein K438DRAFT_454781 [Mycena galopus ATCC 62051]